MARRAVFRADSALVIVVQLALFDPPAALSAPSITRAIVAT